MTADYAFQLYRAYKFFYAGKHLDFERYTYINCPPLIEQKDRHFFYRIAQRLNDETIHALYTIGFFFDPKAYVSTLATPDAFMAALAFASRPQSGDTIYEHDFYELLKRLECDVCHGSGRIDNHVTGEIECGLCEGSGLDIITWLYGTANQLMPPCIQAVIAGELPLDLACMLLLIPQPALNYNWLNTIKDDGTGLGVGPWVDRLRKADQLLRYRSPMWRTDSYRLVRRFWESIGWLNLAPDTAKSPVSALF